MSPQTHFWVCHPNQQLLGTLLVPSVYAEEGLPRISHIQQGPYVQELAVKCTFDFAISCAIALKHPNFVLSDERQCQGLVGSQVDVGSPP